MSVALIDVEQVLIDRVGGFMAEAGMDVTPGGNPALADPVGWALRMLGQQPASLVQVVDGDLSGVTAAMVDALLDLAELRTLESILTNITKVSSEAGPVREEWKELGDRLLKLVPAKRGWVAAMHGRLLAHPLDESDKRSVRIVAL